MQAQDANVKKTIELMEDQRSRVLVIANRKMAWTEFVVEARGAVRRVRSQMLVLHDQEADHEQRKLHLLQVRDWLMAREDFRATQAQGNAEATKKQLRFNQQQTALLESWRRSYALRRVRGLNGEQMGGAIYHALELDQPIRTKSLADWEKNHEKDPASRKDVSKRENHVTLAIAGNMWDTLEKTIMRRFSAPQGAPQDGFIASVDQALMLQNDPMIQTWLKPDPGTLTHRLAGIQDSQQVVSQIYVAILGRLPDADEVKAATTLIHSNPRDRAAIIQELVWGLLASAEFRFIS